VERITMTKQNEKFPVHESLKVLDGETVFKTEKWWLAVLKTESFGRIMVNIYLWVKRGDKWKRQQKLGIRGKEIWSRIKTAVDKFI
jgi:hypothetical protein